MTRPHRTFIPTLLLLALSLGAPGAVLAQKAELRTATAVVPGNVDLLLAIDGASEWRKGPAGPALTSLMTGVVRTQEGGAAWSHLAKELGLSEDAAFDRLLGTRVVFAKRDDAGARAWVLVSTIDRESERLLRQRLQPAPRRVEQGLPIMAIEDGRFWIAASVEGFGARIVLGPADAPGLFDEVSRAVADPPRVRPELPGPAGQLLRRDGGAHALLVARLPADEGGWIGATVTPEGRSFAIQFMVESPLLVREANPVTPWARACFDALDHDAYWRSVEWPGGAGADMLQALGVEDAMQWAEGFGAMEPLDGRVALVLSPSPEALATIVIGCESSDIDSVARAGDSAVGEAVRPLFAGVADAPEVDFGGVFPGAQRNIDLSQTVAGQMLRPLFDSGPVLSWSYTRQRPDHPEIKRGWWTLGLGKKSVAQVSERLTAPPNDADPVAPWISLGSARPSAFVRELNRRSVPLPPSVRPLIDAAGLIERVEWEVLAAGDAALVGRGVLTLEPGAPKP